MPHRQSGRTSELSQTLSVQAAGQGLRDGSRELKEELGRSREQRDLLNITSYPHSAAWSSLNIMSQL